MKTLFDVIESRKQVYLEDGEENKLAIPEFITQNLKYPLFDWQKSALENFLIFENLKTIHAFPNIKKRPTHLLFNMATGSGKTLMMAALMLYYYDKGYRHFLFFVNQNNIVGKTENNFTESSHHKFLFQPKIMYGDAVVPVKKVETFSPNPNGMEIKFTTIQKLYNDIYTDRENQTTLNDLHQLKIVMLADEAHHLNAQTKKKGKTSDLEFEKELKNNTSQETLERKGWEYMVLALLLNKNGNPGANVLLEFTATPPESAEAQEKYADKIIAKFALKDFLQAGFTKEINLVSSTLNKKERVLHALSLAWYRHQIALKYGMANFKPVMLFRSRTIEESRADFEQFLDWVEKLQKPDLDFLQNFSGSLTTDGTPNGQGSIRTGRVLQFIRENDLSNSDIVQWIRQNYQPHNVIITNSQTNKTQTEKTDADTEKLLNNLEAADNPIRAIFTVNRLTEGWDVLNLFDIVRLYEGTNGGGSSRRSGKTPEATVSEKQLIGRGIRYFPFTFDDKPANKRKFDNDMLHELRILEELFYYTHDEESRYISELKAELRKDGFIAEDDGKVFVKFSLKPEWAQNNGFKNLLVWANEKIVNPNKKQNNAKSLKACPQSLRQSVRSYRSLQEVLFTVNGDDDAVRPAENTLIRTFRLPEIEKHIFNKALHIKGKNENSLFHFNYLQEKLGISNRDVLQTDLLQDWTIEFAGSDGDISPNDKLVGCLKILEKVEQHIRANDTPFVGSPNFTPQKLWDIFGQPKQKRIDKQYVNQNIAKNHTWYVLDNFAGNGLEENLVQFIADRMGNFQKHYDVHLLRNEEVLKLYAFSNGAGFMPDFILFLKRKEKSISGSQNDFLHYQIFIEAKGGHLLEQDTWKQNFLNQITLQYGKDKLIMQETPHYRLFGLPFFTENPPPDFLKLFDEIAD